MDFITLHVHNRPQSLSQINKCLIFARFQELNSKMQIGELKGPLVRFEGVENYGGRFEFWIGDFDRYGN
jgi:hypothetical protein